MDWAIDLLIVPALLEFRKPHQPSWTATKDFPISRETDCGDIVGTVSCQRDVFCSSYAQLVLWGWPCIPRTPGRAIVLVTSPGKEDLLLHGSHPLPSTKHWIILDSAHRKKKKVVQLALSFWIRLWIIRIGKSGLETFLLSLFVSTSNHVSSLFLVLHSNICMIMF